MPLSFCVEPDADARRALLAVARQALHAGQQSGLPLKIDIADYAGELAVPGAVFVTLTRDGALRGCVGSLRPDAPLVQAVATAAHNAAYRDRRFDALAADEISALRIEISLLSEMVPLQVRDRAELLELLVPGEDGLLIEDNGLRATFLPKVWQKIPRAADFVGQLMLKAGLPAGHWSPSIVCSRYRCIDIAET
ncbi:MAG: AmmeMemoRadiSam system protein A [Gammaproteobacteria bacterium]|nr:AmmeMemoRadiSam system protein A [Gammaproteobacteria bacterium]